MYLGTSGCWGSIVPSISKRGTASGLRIGRSPVLHLLPFVFLLPKFSYEIVGYTGECPTLPVIGEAGGFLWSLQPTHENAHRVATSEKISYVRD